MSKRPWTLVAVAVAVIIGIAAYGLSPLWAFANLREAARSGDRDRLEQAVDFAAVRESFKSQISADLMQSISADPKLRDNSFAAASALLVPAITDRMIDSYVTPDGIALMLSQGKVSKPEADSGNESGVVSNSSAVEIEQSYRTIDRFRIAMRRSDIPDQTLALTIERRGLFSWKLIRIELPQSVFTPVPAKRKATRR